MKCAKCAASGHLLWRDAAHPGVSSAIIARGQVWRVRLDTWHSIHVILKALRLALNFVHSGRSELPLKNVTF